MKSLSTLHLKENMELLTAENLAKIGALDAFYSVYQDLYHQYEQVEFEIYGEEVPSSHSGGRINDKIRPSAMKAITALLKEYSFLFVADPRVFKQHVQIYREYFSFYYIPHKGNSPKYVFEKLTFNVFLCRITDVIIQCIYLSEKKNNPSCKLSDIRIRLNRHFEVAFADLERENHNSPIQPLPLTEQPLYIFGNLSSTRCKLHNHIIEPRRFAAKNIQDGNDYLLPTHYCTNCKRYMIGEYTLRLYQKSYGTLLLEKRTADQALDAFYLLNTESKLHTLGYNVSEGVYTEKDRHDLLIMLLNEKYITYYEICSTIEDNIKRFSSQVKYINAVQKWKNDLKYLGDYILTQTES